MVPSEQFVLGVEVQITVPSGRVKTTQLPSLAEWVDDGGKPEWFKPGGMVKLSAEGMLASDLPPPPPPSYKYKVPIIRCMYDETFCHLIGKKAESSGTPSMIRVYSPTLSKGGALVKNLPDRAPAAPGHSKNVAAGWI